MFSIICTMLAGIVIGRFLHDGKFLKNIEKSTSLTIAALLFVLGLSIGSNRLIVENLGRVGWQAALLKTWFAPLRFSRFHLSLREFTPKRHTDTP